MSDVAQPGEALTTVRTRGYLPHWERRGAIYFVTFRLADSLPQRVLAAYEAEYEALLARAQAGEQALFAGEKERLERLLSRRIQRYLDSGVGACHLARPAIAEMVAQALRHFNGTRYHLFAWCVMPNHVHVVMEPVSPHHLTSILHSWKSYTANRAHQLLGAQGVFWQHEYYDHLIRDEQALWRTMHYVADNPLKANLQDWPWVEVLLPSEAGL